MISTFRALIREPRDGAAWVHARASRRRLHDVAGAGWTAAFGLTGLVVAFGRDGSQRLALGVWSLIGVVLFVGYVDAFLRSRARVEAPRWTAWLSPATAAWMTAGYVGWLLAVAWRLANHPELQRTLSDFGAAYLEPTPAVLGVLSELYSMLGLTYSFAALTLLLIPASIPMRILATALVLGATAYVMSEQSLRWEWFFVGGITLSVTAFFGAAIDVRSLLAGYAEHLNAERAKAQVRRRHEREMELARSIHTSMQPPAVWTTASGLVVNSYHMTHHKVGGDWLGLRETGDGRVIAVVVDVTGKGVGAALVAHAVQSVWAMGLADRVLDPAAFLRDVNAALYKLGRVRPHTATAGILELNGPTLTYWSAGHCPLRLAWQDDEGEHARTLFGRGDMLGMTPTLLLQPGVFVSPKGAKVDVLFGTDGVFDGLGRGTKVARQFVTKLGVEGAAAVAALPVDDDKSLMWVHYEVAS